MHHKRKRPKNARAGCLMCKTWKVNGFATERYEGERVSDHVRRHADDGESRPPRAKKKRRFGLYTAGGGPRYWYRSARARDAALALFTKRGLRMRPVNTRNA